MIQLFLVRQSGQREPKVTDARGAEGYLGTMYLNGMRFDTIERAQGFVRLPIGAYQLQMYASARLGHVLRPLTLEGHELAGKKNKIRIHAGSIPSHVHGCIAPGFRSASGLPLHGSRTAMETILIACGEWQDRKLVGSLFVIQDYVPPTTAHTAHLLGAGDKLSLHGMLGGL